MKNFVVSGMIWLATLASFAASAQLATNVTITNLSGRVYANVTLDHTNNLGIIWTKSDGSTGMLKYKDLPADVLTRYEISTNTAQAAVAAEQKAKAQLEAKAKADAAQMQQGAEQAAEQAAKQALGMELTASLIKNFPEKVFSQRGYMDAEFVELHPPAGDQFLSSQESATVLIGMTVKDGNGDWFYDCTVNKNLPDGSDYRSNPLAAVAANLKHGDKIRLIGKVIGYGPEFRVEDIKQSF